MDHFHKSPPLSILIHILLLSSSSSLLILIFFFFSLTATTAFDASTVSFDDAYVPLFGEANIVKSDDDTSVKLILNRFSGSGFISSDMYQYGLFSASIKLPSDYTAGIVVAFYASNGDVFEKTHDELDFEFLGNIWGKQWRVQTNIYGNGSTSRGREERYYLPFDPTKESHRYTILWTAEEIFFYIDDTPIRHFRRDPAMGGDYPAKPMSIYATIWDASNWATSGGRYHVNYKYGPFVSEFSDLVVTGCRSDPLDQESSPFDSADECAHAEDEIANSALTIITPDKLRAMREFRQRHMAYSICYDTMRYPVTPLGCEIIHSEKERFKETGHVKITRRKTSKPKRTRARPSGRSSRRAGKILQREVEVAEEAEVAEIAEVSKIEVDTALEAFSD